MLTEHGTMARERNEELIMGDPVVPERPSGRHAAVQEQAGVPAMPVILPSEQDPGSPYPLLEGLSPTIGWHFRPPARGGPVFVIIRRTGLGSLKVVDSFPLTEDGWASAWQSLVRQNPAAAPRVLAAAGTAAIRSCSSSLAGRRRAWVKPALAASARQCYRS